MIAALVYLVSLLLQLGSVLGHHQTGDPQGVPVPVPAVAPAPASAPAPQPRAVAPQPSAAPPAASPSPAGLLAGPTQRPHQAARPSLLERNFDGTIVRLETDPDIAAVLRLPLDAATREHIDRLITERMRWNDRFVRDHYREIIEVRTALTAGKQPDLRMTLKLLEPVRARERFTAVAQEALTAKEVATARAMATEYRDALRAELRKAKPDATDMQIDQRLELEEFGRMVAQSIQRRVDGANARLREVSEQLDLTPEQVERVRAIFMEYAVGAIQGTRPERLTLREWTAAMRQLDEVLTPEQAERLRAILAKRNAE